MAKAEQSRLRPLLYWALGVIAILLVIFLVRRLTREEIEVRVVAATFQPLSKTVSTNGKVEPVDEFPAHAPFPGVIKKIYVQVGQRVSRGSLLVSMDDADARGRLASARAGLTNNLILQRDIDRGGSVEDRNRFASDIASATLDQQSAAARLATQKTLLTKGSVSLAEVQSAQQQLDATTLTLHARQKALDRYDEQDRANASARTSDSRAAVSSAENNVNNIDIHSPIAGTVYNIPVNQFDFVPAGDDVLDVADLSRLQVRAYFDEPDIGGLKKGQAVTIVWDAKRGTVWHGRVDQLPTTIYSNASRYVGICIITVDDPSPDLIPNTNVTVTVTESRRDQVLSIPREALHTDGPRSFVYRIVDGKLAQTTVQVGIVSLTNVEITSGLAVNDTVVLGSKSSLVELTDGLQVKQVP